MEEEKFLSVAEAGIALEMSPRTVRRWYKEGKLPAQKSGKSYVISLDAVEQMRRDLERENTPRQHGRQAAPAEETATDAPCSEDSGQTTEADDGADSSSAEVMKDKPDSDATVKITAEDGGNTGQKDKDLLGEVDQLGERMEALQSRIDRVGQLYADKVKTLERKNRTQLAKVNNLKDWLGVMAVAVAMVTLVMALIFVGHHTKYVHVRNWEYSLQQTAERREKEAIEERLRRLGYM